ncbi:prostaglandin reductase 2-like [Ptychodera flava]|uniref:prostaglandin reductase 2-like n=1 Tax=Ptychodera flava TaxID=63121 RepID=UPI003969C131
MAVNKRVVLRERPGNDNEPTEDNFAVEECPYPTSVPAHHILVKTLYLSVDPYMRCRMNSKTGVTYVSPWQLGQPADGIGVGVVVESKHSNFTTGDIVTMENFMWPWQLYVTLPKERLTKIEKSLVGDHYSLVLGVLGLPGLTALLGIREKGHVVPGTNQTIVVSGAAGACGSLAGQIARLEGCANVVGICGSDEKCQYLLQELGFSGAINYKTENVQERLLQTCPSGIDIYFDNVGGDLSTVVIKQMKPNSHIILCGQIALYNKDVPYPPPIPQDVLDYLQENNITRERYLVLQFREKFPEALIQLAKWVQAGKLKFPETIAEGIEQTGAAFISMMKGGNLGKQLVRVSDP